ncbi:hypothetical protein SCHPADRAFT_906032 [Schizopora paradoxa]|uniref:Uncharacterized protein n=1 Tax=Schizopora paradoxa TaxID=27342 RepID=A0A0H2RHR0_9AGAM|nr:hypothetical protein SCHPADRAFT_906032 [Schizopora paradoxa]
MVGHFFEELTTREPYFAVPRNPHRKDLLSMCLVHRTWAPIVQRLLRKRVRIHSPKRLKEFLDSSACGPWVTELWYIHNKTLARNEKEMLEDLGEVEKSHWDLLAELLGRLPNLRYLSVEMNERPDSFKEQGVLRKEYDKKEASQTRTDFDPYEKVCREEKFEYRGIRDVLSAIGRLSNLEGLVMYCDAVEIERFGSYTSRTQSNYFPYFPILCEQLPGLTSLKYLHISGWSGWYDSSEDDNPRYRYLDDQGEQIGEEVSEEEADAMEEDEDEDGGGRSRVQVEKEPLSEVLIGKSPPASLKTLVLQIPHRRIPSKFIRWLQEPKGDYALENLYVRFDLDCSIMDAITWSATLGEMSRDNLSLMPALRNVRVEFPEKGGPVSDQVYMFERMLRQGVAKLLTQRLTNISSLQASPIFLDASIPPTLTEYHMVLDRVRYESRSRYTNADNRDEIWECRDRAIVDILSDLVDELANRRVTITTMVEDVDIEDVLPKTVNLCEDEGIEVYTARERGVQKRICDFLLQGQVQYPAGKRCIANDVIGDSDGGDGQASYSGDSESDQQGIDDDGLDSDISM